MRKAILILALALPAALYLAACGPTDDAGNRNAGTATNRAATNTTTTTPPPATTTKPPVAATDSQATPGADAPRRITVAEARAAFEKGEAIFVDVRGEDAYRQGHIRGALSVPPGTAAQHANKLPKNKLIITYCA
jgi:3-mercaptopyruvate sulfurtransferase SseA